VLTLRLALGAPETLMAAWNTTD